MKYNKGFTPIIILLIVLGVLAVGGVAYFAGKSSAPKNEVSDNSNYFPTTTNNNPPQQTPPPANNPPQQQTPPPQVSCNLQFTPPQSGILDQQISITSNLLAASWHYTAQNVFGETWGYGVFKCQGGTWNQVYASSPATLELAGVVLTLLPNQSILAVHNEAGAGISADWGVIHLSGNSWVFTSGNTIRNQALTQAGLMFNGYNGVSVVNGNIVEVLPGYANGDARCCPSAQSKTATYSWNGSVLNLVSVQ